MQSKLKSLVRSARNTDLIWRYGYNLSPSLNFALRNRPVLDPVENRIVSDLDQTGIAVSSIEELFDGGSEFDELLRLTDQIISQKKDEIAALRSEAQKAGKVGTKTFLMELLGSDVLFDPADIFARFALKSSFLKIANSYFRMCAKLRYYNVWYTFASTASARESQLWHFDREDNYILKVFLYLRDVNEGTGPFTYAPETHRKGARWNRQPEYSLEGNVRRSTDEQMDAVIPKNNWITATGTTGTIVFADTRGFHKGGEARDADRLMYTCMFTSPASDSKRLLRFPASIDTSRMSTIQRLAVQGG
jgi:hypothetical protein